MGITHSVTDETLQWQEQMRAVRHTVYAVFVIIVASVAGKTYYDVCSVRASPTVTTPAIDKEINDAKTGLKFLVETLNEDTNFLTPQEKISLLANRVQQLKRLMVLKYHPDGVEFRVSQLNPGFSMDTCECDLCQNLRGATKKLVDRKGIGE